MAGVDRSLFGRDRIRSMRLRPQINAAVRPAPVLFKGPAPRRSPDLSTFRRPRHRGQLIGCCTGESGAATGETTAQTPSPLKPDSRPTGVEAEFSPLWVYLMARAETAKVDRSIYQDEGAVVTHALAAVAREGFIPFDAWPATEENYRDFYRVEAEFRKTGRLPSSIATEERIKLIGDHRRLTSREQVLQYVASGYTVWVGTAWTGEMQTRRGPDGRHQFRWGGKLQGGHAWELMHYDLDADEATCGNSWMNVGWGDDRGCAVTSARAVLSELTDARLTSGHSEAVVLIEVGGEWAPKADPNDWTGVF